MISVCAVIVTHNRVEWFERCARSLFTSATFNSNFLLRIVVGLNGPDPSTLDVLTALRQEFGKDRFDFALLDKKDSPSAVRNLLLNKVREDWVYFIDDDAFVPEAHFKNFIEVLSQFPNAVVVGGPALLPEATGRVQRATDVVLTSMAGTYFSTARYSQLGRLPKDCGEESLILCNLFVMKSVVGPHCFPENFVCAEENALLFELTQRRLRLLYCPALFNWHERRGSLPLLFAQTFNYGQGRGQFLLSHPSGIRLAHIIPAAAVIYSVYSILLYAASGIRPDIWIGLACVYAISCGLTPWLDSRSNRPAAPWWSLALFPVIHSGYGIGFLYGIIFKRNARTAS